MAEVTDLPIITVCYNQVYDLLLAKTLCYDQIYDLLLVRTLWYDQVYDLLLVRTLYVTTKFMIFYFSERHMLR
jgi:hypothetical protein